jgi:hypothetical protein
MGKKILLAVVLFIAPLVIRLAWHYRGVYKPPPVPTGELAVPVPPTPPLSHVVEEPTPGKGTIVFDLAHDNKYAPDEFNVLITRLTDRGQEVEFLGSESDEEDSAVGLADRLRYASALVVVSPVTPFDDDEARAVRRFVEKGGRLLLVAEPTRFEYEYDEAGFIVGIKSLVPAINSLATLFDIVFDDDYLYNVQENEANYRNVILRDFAADPLTQDLEEVIFYATHSLRTQDKKLIVADENTFSSLSEGLAELPVMVRSGAGNVVAVGDLTFLTEPYNAVMDNDRLVSNLADFLVGGRRQYELGDFPYFFSDPVDVIQAQEAFLDGRVIAQGGPLQEAFRRAGLELHLRDEEDEKHDTIFLGSFDGAERVMDYLAEEGIELIFVEEEEPTPTPEIAATAELTPTTPTATPTPTLTPTPTPTEEGKKEPPEVDRIAIEGVGEIGMSGTTLFLLTEGRNRHVLIALAEDGESLASALDLLVTGDLYGCFSGRKVTLCSTGEAPPTEKPELDFEEEPTPEFEEEPPLEPGEETPTLEPEELPAQG